MGLQPTGFAAGDFDGDGAVDLAATTSVRFGPDGVVLLFGQGDGSFRSAGTLNARAASILSTDLNGDGNLDLATVGNALEAFLGNGDGTFQTTRTSALGERSDPRDIVGTDFDGDGVVDIAVLMAFHLLVFLGGGDGSFASPRISGIGGDRIVSADFDGNGLADLATAGNWPSLTAGVVLLGAGDGTFQRSHALDPIGVDSDGLADIGAGDLNSDGLADIVVAVAGFRCALYIGRGDGTFEAPASVGAAEGGYRILLADVDEDGILDLARSHDSYRGGVDLLFGRGDGTFDLAGNLPTGSEPLEILSEDLDGDERLDLVTSYENDGGGCSGKVRLLRGNGDGSFQAPAELCSECAGPGRIVPADMNDDGHVDILTSYVDVVLGHGDGSFEAALGFSLSGRSVAVADFDGDRRLDVAVLRGEDLRLLLSSPEDCRPRFLRGYSNGDNNLDLTDAVFVLNYLFLGGPEPTCLDSGDTDDNGTLEITDPAALLNFLFLGGPAPVSPFRECGTDVTDDHLTCESFPSCP